MPGCAQRELADRELRAPTREGSAKVATQVETAGLHRDATLRDVSREWARIGCIGFGGPPAHIALLRELCERCPVPHARSVRLSKASAFSRSRL